MEPLIARELQSHELLPAHEFLERLRSVVAFREQPVVPDPLQHAVNEIVNNPAYSQSRLLLRVLVSLGTGTGEYRVAELATFDATTLALVRALLDCRAAGSRPHADWTDAIAKAQAAAV